MLMCSMGVAPSTLVVTPEKMVNTSSLGPRRADGAAQELSRA
jgi:hypothetical protein